MKNLFFKKAGKIIVFSVALITVFLLNSQQGKSQTTLARGDVAFLAMQENSNSADTFVIVLLKNIASGTQISFTDGNWDDGNNYITLNNAMSEWVFTWEATSSMTAGTQIKFHANTKGSAAGYGAIASEGSIVAGRALSLTIAGDQIFAFQGGTIDTTTNYRITSISRFLAGIHLNVLGGVTNDANWDDGSTVGTSTSELPDSLVTGTHAIRLDSSSVERQNAKYNGTCNSTVLTVLNDKTNWSVSNTPPSPSACVVPTNTTWNGTIWSNGAPTSTLDAIIASSTTPGSFTCKNLTINSGVSLTIGSGVTATIYADLTNSGNGTSGVGTLRFAGSTAQAINGTAFTHSGVVEVATSTTLTTNSKLTIANGGSLMHGTSTPNGGGSVSGNVTFEKTIGNTTKGWRMFSIPVNDLIDNFETGLNTLCSNHTPSGERNVYYWDPTNVGLNTAAGWTQANNTTDDETKAYGIYLDNTSHNAWDFSGTVSITGAPNDGSATYNLQYTYDPNSSKTLSQQRGWNFIPNYFPSNLSVYDLINDGNFGSTYKAIHIWDQGTSQMIGLNQSTMNSYNNSSTSRFSTIRQISPFTGFWIKATSTSQSIQLKNSMRTSRTDSLPASTYFKTEPDIFGIEVKDANGNLDRFVVTFIDGAEYGFDEFDLYKFKSFSEDVPTVYTKIAGEEELSYSAMPVAENYSIPVNVESFKDGRAYTVKALKDQYKNYYEVELVDNKTGSKTDLLNNDYTFNFDKNFSAARLTLNFKKKSATSVDELFSNERMYAYTEKGAINVVYNNDNTMANADVEVYNMMGQKLFAKGNVKGGDVVSFAPASNGQVQVYIVKVISNGKAQTIKVVY